MSGISLLYDSIKVPFLTALWNMQDRIYGLHVTDNRVFRFAPQNGEMRYICRIPGILKGIEKAFGAVLCYKNLILLIPFREEKLVIYDREKDTWKQVGLGLLPEMKPGESFRGREISGNMPGYFYGGCLYKDKLFLLPFGYRGLMQYHLDTGEIFHCFDFKKTVLREDVALFHNFAWMDEAHIALSCLYSNHVAILDLENGDVEITTVGGDGCRFSTIIKYGKDYWLVVKNRLAFIRWSPHTDEQEEYTEFPTGCEISNEKHCFDDSNIYLYEDCLYCFPASCNMAVKFHLQNGTVEEIKVLSAYCRAEELDRKASTFNGGIRIDDKVYLHYQLRSILIFDLKTEEVCTCDRTVKDVDSIARMERETFAEFIGSLEEGKKANTKSVEKAAGKTIYDAVSKLIL